MCYTQYSDAGTLDSMRALLPRELLAVVLFILVKPLGSQQNGHEEEWLSREACGRWQESFSIPSGALLLCIYPHTLGLIHHEFFGTLWYCLIYMYANRLLMYLKLG